MSEATVVTGGAGFIGSHLVELLVLRGQEVRVLERPGADVSHLPKDVEIVTADVRDAAAVQTALEGARWVYHLAANPNLWVRRRAEFFEVNHLGTVNVLEASKQVGVERVLHTSTESILTCNKPSGPITEDVEVALADAVGPYCLSKLLAENEAFRRARLGEPVVVVNPTMPVGPGDRGLSPPTRLIRDFSLGKLPGAHRLHAQSHRREGCCRRHGQGDGERHSRQAAHLGWNEPELDPVVPASLGADRRPAAARSNSLRTRSGFCISK